MKSTGTAKPGRVRADFAVIGLGRIGGGLAQQALAKGLSVAGFSRHGPPSALVEAGLRVLPQLADLHGALDPPRVVLLYIPAGPGVDDLLEALSAVLEPGDIVADGGNSYWGDSIRRAERLRKGGIRLVDVGTSGGIEGARRGACFMVGGDTAAVAIIEPTLRRLAVDGGYVHAGPPGAGHFTKLVHNGIEFAMLQAIGEGVDLLERAPMPLPVADVLRAWRHGSVIRSWLVDLMDTCYRQSDRLEAIPPVVEDTGEVNWLVADALALGVAIPAIAVSAMQLVASRDDRQAWARAIAAMRHGFGGHAYGRDEETAREREEGRVGGFVRAKRPADEAHPSDKGRHKT